jgi:S-formylglutathione hydrolase FrmB
VSPAFSAGGTCAVDLAVMHPELFSAFADLAGDLSPNSGTKAQTIDRLFGGSVEAWSRFDPSTVITQHGPYQGVSGVFTVVSGQDAAANTLCGLALTNGIECTVATVPGEHDWPFAGRAWAAALPWLAGVLGTPGTLKPQLSPQRSGRSAAAPSNTR